ncbi:alpha/beta hydrolase [Phenylobacterium sp. J426]|uniref:alpha/beta fold hydrolase n=1 Tax=Phenylobacterium sp. J426 TaxID=2898439 RepID=UPI002150EAF3|nr:alpha/beta hydrolase [Phenylobacterium sp. J426]MCR5875463.1 alpha/beta hydrolase [Phenylobacterium sp. J426]
MNAAQRNNATIRGEGGPTLLLSHGFGCDQNMWRFVAPQLSAGATCVMFDHVGSGGSNASGYDPQRYGSLDAYADDAIQLCDDLGLKDVIFVGHSVSASIGVLAAVKRPELFGGLVLICASPRYSDTEDYVGGFAEADLDELLELMAKNQIDFSQVLSPIVFGADQAPQLEEEWRRNVCQADPAIAADFARATFKSDHRAAYRQVRVPTLLIECSDDALAPPQVGRWVNAAIEGSTRQVLQASGHSPHLTHPDQVISRIGAFLADQTRRGTAPQ